MIFDVAIDLHIVGNIILRWMRCITEETVTFNSVLPALIARLI